MDYSADISEVLQRQHAGGLSKAICGQHNHFFLHGGSPETISELPLVSHPTNERLTKRLERLFNNT